MTQLETPGLFSVLVDGSTLGRDGPEVTRGTVVTIIFGPFSGLSGVVISSSARRTVVRLILKGRSVLVDLDTDMIRVPVRNGSPRAPSAKPRSRPV